MSETHPLTTVRTAKDWTQVEMADFLGITQAHLSRLEAGLSFCSPRLARKISKLTGIGLDRLVNFGDNGPDRVTLRRRALRRTKR